MGTEIERKFLISNQQWRPQTIASHRIRQGYLSTNPLHTIRIRIKNQQAWLTIKSKPQNLIRKEYEYLIPHEDALEMLDSLCTNPHIEKIRHHVVFHGHLWEIDEFLGQNEGLFVAEIELSHPEEEFVPPLWLGKEVSHNPAYTNSQLSLLPFCNW